MRRRWLAVALGLGLLLVTLVSPFSYLPNPVGLYYLIVGGYSYDPSSPFVNRFATLLGDPVHAVSIKLDRLIGQTGLDPLDPNQPLIAYTVLRATSPSLRRDPAPAYVELRYADGSARTYEIPLMRQYSGSTSAWRYSALDRFFAEHRALPGMPFADASSPVALGPAKRLGLALEAHLLTNEGGVWDTSNQQLRWAPDQKSFLLQAVAPGVSSTVPRDYALWLVPLDGGSPRRIAHGATAYGWGPDGRQILYIRRPQLDLVALDVATGVESSIGRPDGYQFWVSVGMAYFLNEKALWRKPLDDQPAERLRDLLGATSPPGSPVALAVSPDGQRLAFRCGDDLCLEDLSGQNRVQLSLGDPRAFNLREYLDLVAPRPSVVLTPAAPSRGYPLRRWILDLAWTRDGQRLAALAMAPGNASVQELWIVDRSGSVQQHLDVAPDGTSSEPQWTPDGRFVFLNTFPLGGRRLIVVEADTGRILDLSQPRWDTFASLSPDGTQILLWTGRGGFWTVPLEVLR